MRSRSSVPVLTVLALLAGCAHQRIGYTGGTVLAVAGSVLVLETQGDHCAEREIGEALGCGFGNVVTGSVGVTMLAVGVGVLLVTAITSDVEPAPPALATAQPARAPRRAAHAPLTTDAELRRLTLQAMVAAGAGQCVEVEAIARQVATIDARYRNEGFLTDASIASCLP